MGANCPLFYYTNSPGVPILELSRFFGFVSPRTTQHPQIRYCMFNEVRDPHLVITNPHGVMFTSTRFFVLTGNSEALAVSLIKNPKVIGPKRAQMLFNLAAVDNNKIGRDALKLCAKAANRHHVDGLINDRVFNKASTKRLQFWAQNKNTPV